MHLESSKQNHYFISLWAIIKTICIFLHSFWLFCWLSLCLCLCLYFCLYVCVSLSVARSLSLCLSSLTGCPSIIVYVCVFFGVGACGQVCVRICICMSSHKWYRNHRSSTECKFSSIWTVNRQPGQGIPTVGKSRIELAAQKHHWYAHRSCPNTVTRAIQLCSRQPQICFRKQLLNQAQ